MPEDARSMRVMSGGASSGGEELTSYDGKRKAEMTADERVTYERERNRVHARNTRARKKQYIEELKESVQRMRDKRAAAERQKEQAMREEEEEVRRWEMTLARVLDLRCEGVTDESVWKEVLSDNFRLFLPMTPYRSYDPSDIEEGRRRVLIGVEGMISDTKSLTELCVTIAERCRQKTGDGGGGGGGSTSSLEEIKGNKDKTRVHLKSFVGSEDIMFASSDGIMCKFSMNTVDARQYGSPVEVEKNGMLRATFTEDGRVDELDMMFDGVAVHQQLQWVMGRDPRGDQSFPSAGVHVEKASNTPIVNNENVAVSTGEVAGATGTGGTPSSSPTMAVDAPDA